MSLWAPLLVNASLVKRPASLGNTHHCSYIIALYRDLIHCHFPIETRCLTLKMCFLVCMRYLLNRRLVPKALQHTHTHTHTRKHTCACARTHTWTPKPQQQQIPLIVRKSLSISVVPHGLLNMPFKSLTSTLWFFSNLSGSTGTIICKANHDLMSWIPKCS